MKYKTLKTPTLAKNILMLYYSKCLKEKGNKMDLKKIEELIKLVNNSGLSEFKLEEDGMKIKLVNQPVYVNVEMPLPPSPHHHGPTPEPPANAAPAPTEDFIFITSPLVGVYKPLSASDKTPVKVGDKVAVGQPVCVVEAMKLINEIESDIAGEIVEILVSEGDTVEYGQEIFKLRRN